MKSEYTAALEALKARGAFEHHLREAGVTSIRITLGPLMTHAKLTFGNTLRIRGTGWTIEDAVFDAFEDHILGRQPTLRCAVGDRSYLANAERRIPTTHGVSIVKIEKSFCAKTDREAEQLVRQAFTVQPATRILEIETLTR